MKYPRVQNFINGRFVPSENPENIDLISPVNGEKISEVPISTIIDLNEAVQVAKNAFLSWSVTPLKERVQVFGIIYLSHPPFPLPGKRLKKD
jgi:malonate-semialdehyde dehydrogenase (acetylating)/methylmalonate-semialdehyde dehydrogenase